MKSKVSSHEAFRIRLSKSLADARQQRRGEASALAAALWIEQLKHRNHCSTANQLEKLFEPEGFYRNKDGEICRRNKWSKYETGKRSPNPDLVRKIEKISPGSARVLNHPLWKIIGCKKWNIDDSGKWLIQLSPEIRSVFQSTNTEALCKSINKKLLKMLERRADLDALAALTALLFNAIEIRDEKGAFAVGESLYRTLLIVGSFTSYLRFSSELFSLFNTHTFSKITCDGLAFDIREDDFKIARSLLSSLLLVMEDNCLVKHASLKSFIQTKLRLLDGYYGFAIEFAMRLPLKPIAPRDENNSHLYDRCELLRQNRDWGLSVVLEGRNETLPPFLQ